MTPRSHARSPRLHFDHENMNSPHTQPFQAGKYLVTPLSRTTANSRHTASVSIRSGQGRGTHDRIYTFIPEFPTRDSALVYAADQGRHWLLDRAAFA
jgi:hypothetical protein